MARKLLALALVCLVLSGCGSGGSFVGGTTLPANGTTISGKLLSGVLPVAGAHVYLMAVAETGYGKPSLSLLNAGSTGFGDSTGTYVVTASDGTFTIPGQYSCSAETNVYVLTKGGNSGPGENSAATQLAAVGACPQQGTVVSPLVVDEVTTVAMVFALAGFATDSLHVASSGSPLAMTGMAKAFVNASHLASVSSGTAPGMLPSGAGTVPQATINTLANILSSCIHSAGAGSSACQSLLGNAGSAPPYNDTAAAMFGIAHSPASAVATLFAQQSVTPPFTPYLKVSPNDFSLGVVFIGGGINQTSGMAVDGMGNIWSNTLGGYAVTEISSDGVFLSGSNGYFATVYAAGPIAIDTVGNVWIGNGAHTLQGTGSLLELSSSGATLATYNSGGAGLRNPLGLSIDGSNHVWVADTLANNIVEFSNSGQVLSGTKGFTAGGISNPATVAIDALGNAWVGNSGAYSLSELSNSGGALTSSTGITGPGFYGGGGLAFDHQGNTWVVAAGSPFAQVAKVSSSGAILSGSGYVGGGITAGYGGTSIAIDGDGNAWIPLYSAPGVVELSNSGVPLSGNNGYGGGVALSPNSLVIDGSGDVWVASATLQVSTVRGVPSVYTWRITELIGIAAPVVTPLAVGVQSNTLGSRP